MKTYNDFIKNLSINENNETEWTIEKIGKIANNYKNYKDFKKNYPNLWTIASKNKWLEWLFPEYKPAKSKGYWDNKENIRQEAEKYSRPIDFYKNNQSAYNATLKHGWMDEFFPFKNTWGGGKRIWYFDNMEELASKYDTLSDFRKNEPAAYDIATHRKWINALFDQKRTMKKKHHWNEENVRKEAEKYSSRKEFAIKNSSAYNAARKLNLLDEYYQTHVSPKWTEENVRKEAKKYISRNDFQTKKPSGYNVARKMGILDELFPKRAKRRSKWTEENVRKEAKKYNSKKEFKDNEAGAHEVGRRLKILDELFPKRAKRHSKWTEENVRKEAKKYNSRKEFNNKKQHAYNAAKKLDLLDELFPIKKINNWTEENVRQEAKKYISRTEFQSKKPGGYKAARKLNLLDELFPKNNMKHIKSFNESLWIK